MVANASFLAYASFVWYLGITNNVLEEAMLVQVDAETISPSDNDTRIARASSKALAALMRDEGDSIASIHIRTKDLHEANIPLPLSAVHLLLHALQEMAEGHSVALVPVDTELTTQQAAELMRVSRPSLIKMLDDRKLPYRKVGAHRRVRYEDVMNYLKTERDRRTKTMMELVEETERLGLY
jgi:excisionase family DNA binding protein